MSNKPEPTYTVEELHRMWKRPYAVQIGVAQAKIMEAFLLTNGNIYIAFSGGKDSTVLMHLAAPIWKSMYPDKPLLVIFNDTTNEYSGMYAFAEKFCKSLENEFGMTIDLQKTRPEEIFTRVVRCVGMPFISKRVSRQVSNLKAELKQRGQAYEEVKHLFHAGVKEAKQLRELGYSKTFVLFATGYDQNFKSSMRWRLARKWLPLIVAPFELSEKCCHELKKKPSLALAKKLGGLSVMTGEMAQDSEQRQSSYLLTGCNNFDIAGYGKSKPLGATTEETILRYIDECRLPLSPCYGQLKYKKNLFGNKFYHFTGVSRSGCCICGFGIEYFQDKFIVLQKLEPAKVKHAFTDYDKGGLGYRQICEYLNAHCGMNIKIPVIKEREQR